MLACGRILCAQTGVLGIWALGMPIFLVQSATARSSQVQHTMFRRSMLPSVPGTAMHETTQHGTAWRNTVPTHHVLTTPYHAPPAQCSAALHNIAPTLSCVFSSCISSTCRVLCASARPAAAACECSPMISLATFNPKSTGLTWPLPSSFSTPGSDLPRDTFGSADLSSLLSESASQRLSL
jgi:hypothetical protein